MGSRRRSPSRLGQCLDNVASQPCQASCASEFGENGVDSVSIRWRKGRGVSPNNGEGFWTEEELIRSRENEHAKCTSSTKSHNSRNYFSLANGLILILILLLCWTTCQVHGGYPGRGPPSSPRGPPLLPHHPLSGHHFNRRRPHPPPHHQHLQNGPPSRGRHPRPHHLHSKSGRKGHHHGGNGDLSVAAQTLYDLRGYQFPLAGPENPRYHRQNDPFTLPTPLASNPRGTNGGHGHVSQDTRTAPLVFPSFYQEQPTPTPTRATIFGHNQHLSQTRFEPPNGFHLGGNSASGKITLEQQSASSRDQFRPSQIDISLHSNQVTPSPSPFGPQAQTSTLAPEKKSLASTNRPRATVKLNKNQQQDPFVYVYDEVDYDEGEDDFVLAGGRQRAPQGQINSNRITPSTSTTTVAPLRGREPTIVPTPLNQFPQLQYHQPQQFQHNFNQNLYTTTTTTKPPPTTQNSLFYSPQKDDYRNPYYEPVGITRPPVTPRPNVEIVPSSERKPPPDQSNAIAPALNRFPQSTIRDFNRPPQQLPVVTDVIDLRRRQPPGTTTTTLPPPIPPNGIAPQFQREAIFPHLQQYQQPQGRQVNPNPSPTPIPYFPQGLDRRPFETTNDIPSIQTKNQFDQVVNLLQEEEEEYSNNNGASPNLQDQAFNNPSKLRPVNTLIPKNRFPKEDFVLPPNFHFTHAQDFTTPLIPVAPERNRGETTQQRLRDQTTRIREELPRPVPTQPQSRPRPQVRPQEEEVDDNIVNQHHSQLPPQPAAPSRARGRQPQQQRTTTTPPSVEVPQRTRTNSARQRLRPNYRQSTTTTTTSTTSTTPVPSYVEYPSQEYLDDYNDNQQYSQSPAPPAQVVSPIVPQVQKPISTFPPFPNKNKKKEEVSTVPPTPLQRQRPTLAGRQRPGKGNRFRETTTQDVITSPRTTGKPLYTTGKMLSKEGGLYAGQMITSSHVYGNPVPNIPINSVLDKMPGVLNGNSVFLATTKPSNFGSPQKHLRSKQRFPEHGPPSRITSSSHRLRPTAKPSHENGLDIVETVTLRPFSSEQDKSKEEHKRLRAGSQFIRGSSQQQTSTERGQDEGQQVLPRRRKRPGQRRPLQQHQPDPFTETINIHSSTRPTEDEDVSSYQTERAQILRESPVTESSAANNVTPRSRRPRPRPGKLNQSADLSNVSERSREREEDSQSRAIDEPQKPLKPPRKLRPRLRTVPVGQLNAQQQRGSPSEVVPQSQSAQVERKPTDAPGRFSSRFREQENFESSTVSTLRGDERETGSSTGPSRFSPPTARLTFKPPPPKQTTPRKRPQQQNSDGEADALPDSIKLSPKDVIANRKPARRIPPGSASDRLKALQQRRNKVFGGHQQGEAEQTAEGRQVPVSKRPRLKPILLGQGQENQLPQPQRLRRPNQASPEQTGPKREILPNSQQRGNKLKNEVDYYNEENERNQDDAEEENEEYNNDEQNFTSPSPQSQLISASVTARPGRNHGGFHRNRSVEVTSDEARSVLGIPRPASPSRAPPGKRLRFQKKFQYDDEEIEEDRFNEEEQFQDTRPVLQNNPPRLKFRQNNNNNNNNNDRFQREEEEPIIPSREIQTALPQRQKGGSRQVSRERIRQRPSQERFREEEPEEEEQEDYRDELEDREPPRKSFLKQNQRFNNGPSSFQKVFRNKKLKTEQGIGNRSRQQVDDEEEPEENEQLQDEQDEEITPSSERTTTTTSSSSTSSSSTSTSTSASSPSPLEESEPESPLPVRAGPQPIKMGVLKARLRPNRRQKQQAEVSISVTTTEATITEERSQPGLKHGSINVSKSLRPRLHSGGGGKRTSKKFIAMATENPSLPLESIFPEV